LPPKQLRPLLVALAPSPFSYPVTLLSIQPIEE